MPYFVYKITAGATPLLKDLTLLKRCDEFKDARQFARGERAEHGSDPTTTIKVMFADTELQAEEQLLETRDAPVLREWEK
jgi:hypothetical protein